MAHRILAVIDPLAPQARRPRTGCGPRGPAPSVRGARASFAADRAGSAQLSRQRPLSGQPLPTAARQTGESPRLLREAQRRPRPTTSARRRAGPTRAEVSGSAQMRPHTSTPYTLTIACIVSFDHLMETKPAAQRRGDGPAGEAGMGRARATVGGLVPVCAVRRLQPSAGLLLQRTRHCGSDRRHVA